MLKDNDRINIISVVATPNVTVNDFANVLITTLTTDYGYIQVEYNTSADAYVSRSIVTESVTSMNADDVVVVPAGNITSTDVQAALEELDGFIDVIVQEGTTASNGLTKTALDIALGGTLTANTLVNSGAFYLDLLGNLRLRPSGISATSQNKTLQLANTTGVLSLVNKDIYYRRSGTYAAPVVLASPVPNGLAPATGVNIVNLATAGVMDFTAQVNGVQSSRIVNSGVDDVSNNAFGILLLQLSNFVGTKAKIKITLDITSDLDIIALPIAYSGYAVGVIGYYVEEQTVNIGCPKLLSGTGYREGKFCAAGEKITIESNYIVNIYTATFENWSTIGIYRNTGLASDGTIANVSVHGWSFEAIQI
jgi:hypothetical protein